VEYPTGAIASQAVLLILLRLGSKFLALQLQENINGSIAGSQLGSRRLLANR